VYYFFSCCGFRGNRASESTHFVIAGKTRCINHFLINDSWYLVDLPGYGYAKASQDKRVAWNEFTKTFFLERTQLVTVFLLVDSSVPPQQIDIECSVWLAEANVPFTIIFTKADKAKKRSLGIEENVSAFCQTVEDAIGRQTPAFLTSAANGTGAASVLRHVGVLRQEFEVERSGLRLSSPLLASPDDESTLP
jgi:GTP-binding protein